VANDVKFAIFATDFEKRSLRRKNFKKEDKNG
jgi:hypothetical protein